jgi:hypothetical protein
MKTVEGPPLELLLRRLSECPPDFLEPPAGPSGAGIDVTAIACDTLRRLTPDAPPETTPALWGPVCEAEKLHQQFIALVCWLFADECFQSRPDLASAMWKLLTSNDLAALSRLVRPQQAVQDPDRREELVRICLAELGLRPRGESETAAADRLTTLNSAERARVLRQTAAAERRARDIRERMARAAARDAASRYGE